MKIKCIAIDDEYLAMDIIEEYVKKIPFLELIEKFDNAISAIAYINQNEVDLLFLDIQMKELTGIQLLKSLRVRPMVILTTAYDNYALESYEFDVMDYLLKPISFERFVKSADKAYNQFLSYQLKRKMPKEHLAISNLAEDFFFVKSGTVLERIVFDDILYIKGERDYLSIVTEQRKILVLLNFKYFEDLLPKDRFFRVHKSYMVALNKIVNIENNMIHIKDTSIPIGSSYRTFFLAEITKRK